MTVLEEFLRIGAGQVHVMDKAERGDASREKSQAAGHPFRRGEGEFPLAELMLQIVDREVLVALKTDQIVTVPLVVPHEQVLAVGAVDELPILERGLYGRERRMPVIIIGNAVRVEEIQDGADPRIDRFVFQVRGVRRSENDRIPAHFTRLLA